MSKKKMMEDTVLKEMLRQCVEDAATKMADKLADKEQAREDLLFVCDQNDDQLIAKMTALEEKMEKHLTTVDGQFRPQRDLFFIGDLSMAENQILVRVMSEVDEEWTSTLSTSTSH